MLIFQAFVEARMMKGRRGLLFKSACILKRLNRIKTCRELRN